MSEILSQGLTLLDIVGADKNLKVSEALSVILGAGTQSNTYKINQLFTNILASIDDLESRNALTDVNAAYVSESGGTENFTGVVAELEQYNKGMVLIFTIPQNNKGAVTINLNSLGAKAIKKYNNAGALVDLEADDFVRNHKYFLEYDGTQFVTLCENSVQELKQLTSKLQTHEGDKVVHITSEERTQWNGKSVVTKSDTNGSVMVDGKDVVVYTHPEGTNPHGTTKADVGLSNVENERQYSEQNPPPYPVTSVNGETGAVVLTTSSLENDSDYQTGTQVNSTVNAAVDALKDGVDESLDTLKELAAAINNNPNYHTTTDEKINQKANKSLDNLDDGVLLAKGKEAGLLDSETASTTYETQSHASETYETKENASQTYETKENVQSALQNKADKTELPHKVVVVKLLKDSWTEDENERFSQNITHEYIESNTKLNVAPSDDTVLQDLIELGVSAMVAKNDNGSASVIFYGAKPENDVMVQVEIVPVILD
jgi:hypothetical protein